MEETEFTVAQRCRETENRRMHDIRIMGKGRVNITRVDTVKEDGKVRILDENEKGCSEGKRSLFEGTR